MKKNNTTLEKIAQKFMLNGAESLAAYKSNFSLMIVTYLKSSCEQGTVIDLARANMFQFFQQVDFLLSSLQWCSKKENDYLSSTFDSFYNPGYRDKNKNFEEHSFLMNSLTELILTSAQKFDDGISENEKEEILVFSDQLRILINDLCDYYIEQVEVWQKVNAA